MGDKVTGEVVTMCSCGANTIGMYCIVGLSQLRKRCVGGVIDIGLP
jgi:hypothetical protein